MSIIRSEEFDMVQDHVHSITERELDMILLKMGSLLSILQNKKTNHAKLLIHLVKDLNFRNCFMKITELDGFEQAVRILMEKYPSLCESKVVSGALSRDNKSRKKSV